MNLLLLALGIPVLSGSIALFLYARPRAAIWSGISGAVAGCGIGIVYALQNVSGQAATDLRIPWQVPYGEFHISVDPLSAVFLLAIFGLGLLTAIYSGPYLLHYRKEKSLSASSFFFNLLLSSMALLVVSRNGILFLVAWEVMAIASFFLVTFEDEKPEVRNAGWTYLIMAHAGTAFLLAFFAILGREAGSLDFDNFSALQLAPATATGLFLLALTGFGAKAGFIPLHVWLPEAHPAAPSHVSAVMSGVMIKTGIYGILRALTFLGPPPAWWGILLILIGLVSGILGVLFALAQHDLKRLLAYHSVENIGIIALGMGVGVWGLSHGLSFVAIFGFSGAMLHVLNHAVFKGLLFLGAGSVLHSTGERNMDRLGGLMKPLPVTGATFLIAAAAISGLPPLNGFVSEFLIMYGSLKGALATEVPVSTALLGTFVGMGLIGGLAVACFAKAFGVVFLGSPRNGHAPKSHGEPAGFKLPMLALAAVCAFIGILPFVAIRLVLPAASQIAGEEGIRAATDMAAFSGTLGRISFGSSLAVLAAVCLVLLRKALLRGRIVSTGPTWGCGYERPTTRMQYSSSSFAQPLLAIFRILLRSRQALHPPVGYFPRSGGFRSETPDVFSARIYRPLQWWIERMSLKLRWLQHGRVHLYLLYIFVTLVVLLVWRLRF